MAYEFHNTNLQGADFRGKNLASADFSYADIRGTNFSNAILVGANFRNAKAGIPISKAIASVIILLFLSLFAGLISGYAGAYIGDLINNSVDGSSSFGIISLISLATIVVIIFRRGFSVTLVVATAIITACLIASVAVFGNDKTGINLTIAAESTALGLIGTIAGVGYMAVVVAVAKVINLARANIITVSVALLGVVLGVSSGVRTNELACLIAGLIALLAIIYGVYIAGEAIAANKKYELVRALAVGIVSQISTSFRGADLTDADFTEASLKSVDLRLATLTRTCWFAAKKLEQARVEGTYLQDVRVRQLLITKDGRDKNYDNLNLRGLNLKDANLQDASFISTDLSKTTLENANISGAKLAQAQLYKSNLTAACLTGAYLQNWGISTDTKIEAIKCEYIYMQLPTKEDPDPCRKPDNRNETFKEGDFADFIAPIIKTLDLYQTQNVDPRQVASKFKTLDLLHYEGIDPTAAAIAITQLTDNYPEAELKVVSLEGRGQEKIKLQARVTGDANRSKLYNEYFQTYTQIKSLSYHDMQAVLLGIQEKDERIQSLEKLLENAIQQPKFYVETYQTQGNTIMSESKGNISINGAQGNISGVAAAGEDMEMTGVAMGAISGNVSNAISQLPDALEPDKVGIKELLQELQLAIKSDINLNDEDKADALEQVQKIAEAGQKPKDEGMQKVVKNAIKILKGTIADLPSTVQLVQSCGKLLPLVTQFFGF